MIARIQPTPLCGRIAAIPSKSEAHRLLICAALADAPTCLQMRGTSQDIEATIRCLRALGSDICANTDHILVSPIQAPPVSCELDVGESGTTLRFMLCIAAVLGVDARFILHGRLPGRPMAELEATLASGGCKTDRSSDNVLCLHGKLRPGVYTLPGNVSSQYISGMLMALGCVGGASELRITGGVESTDYIRMTLHAMRCFGVIPKETEFCFSFSGAERYISPKVAIVDGDWSNAAFWLCAGALPNCEISVSGLDPNSAQGDRRIAEIVKGLPREIDASPIPDLIPAAAALYAALGLPLRVVNAARLRLKESDRIKTVCAAINALGGSAHETADGLTLTGSAPLSGGRVDAAGDHRIAMMTAVAAIACAGSVEIAGAEAVAKSYPDFWRDYAALGGRVELI